MKEFYSIIAMDSLSEQTSLTTTATSAQASDVIVVNPLPSEPASLPAPMDAQPSQVVPPRPVPRSGLAPAESELKRLDFSVNQLLRANRESKKGLYILPLQYNPVSQAQIEGIFSVLRKGDLPPMATQISVVNKPQPGTMLISINMGTGKFIDGYSWKKIKDASHKVGGISHLFVTTTDFLIQRRRYAERDLVVFHYVIRPLTAAVLSNQPSQIVPLGSPSPVPVQTIPASMNQIPSPPSAIYSHQPIMYPHPLSRPYHNQPNPAPFAYYNQPNPAPFAYYNQPNPVPLTYHNQPNPVPAIYPVPVFPAFSSQPAQPVLFEEMINGQTPLSMDITRPPPRSISFTIHREASLPVFTTWQLKSVRVVQTEPSTPTSEDDQTPVVQPATSSRPLTPPPRFSSAI